MKINFPAECLTPASRLEWSHAMQEKLRLLQKYMRLWHVEGISQNIYNQFPNKVKNLFDYTGELLPNSDYKNFLRKLEEFETALWVALGEEKQKAFDSTYWNPDIDGDIN